MNSSVTHILHHEIWGKYFFGDFYSKHFFVILKLGDNRDECLIDEPQKIS